MKKAIITVLKTLLTIGIFVSLFYEFGGGIVPVSRQGFADGTIYISRTLPCRGSWGG